MFCQKCGSKHLEEFRFCSNCGDKVPLSTDLRSTVLPPPVSPLAAASSTTRQPYATPGRRLVAGVIDIFIMIVLGVIAGLTFPSILADSVTDEQQLKSALDGVGYLIGWLYYSLMECSPLQATVGKSLLGLKVTDLEGDRINFFKSSGRHWGKLISTLLMLFGCIMILFTNKKQGLHDKMAGCLVVYK